jgi:hypothetical protein
MKAEDSHDHPPLPSHTATSPTFHLHQINSHLPRQPDQPIIPSLGHNKHALYITLHFRGTRHLPHRPGLRGKVRRSFVCYRVECDARWWEYDVHAHDHDHDHNRDHAHCR